MLGFIFGVLIIGALLSVIFGKRVGQLFALGTAGIVFLIIGAFALVVIAGLIHMQFLPKETYPPRSADQPYTYVAPIPADQSTPPAPAYPATPNVAPAYPIANAPTGTTTPAAPTVTTTPRVGIQDGQAPAPQDAAHLTRCRVPVGVGDYVYGVYPGSPAQAAGLRVGDILVSAWVNGTPRLWLNAQYNLADFEEAHVSVPTPQPISLHIFRLAENRDFYVNVTPR